MKRILAVTGALALAPGAWALGYRLYDHDAFATARGDAFVATADNPSAIYYNPAGITQLQGHNVRAGLFTIGIHSDFNPDAPGRNIETKDEFVPVPSLYYTYTPENSRFSFGAGLYTPFGLKLEWPDRSPFRNVTTMGQLEHSTLAGIVAYKISPELSIAAGPTFNYARAELRRGLSPLTRGDEFRFKGDDTDFGATAGIFWQPHTKHAFGIAYRSQTTMNLKGHSSATPAVLPRQHAEVELPNPDVIVGGYSFRPSTNWNFEVDLDYTDWSRVKTLTLKQTPSAKIPLNYVASWTVEAGATRYWGRDLHVSGGYVFIQNSVSTHSFNPLVPDQDMHVFMGGVGGELSKISWDLTYQYLMGVGRDVSGSVNGPGVAGHYNFTGHAISISLGYRF